MSNPNVIKKSGFNLNASDICEEFVIEPNNTQHIIILVPGTTDPVNINEKSTGNANQNYWDKAFLEGMEKFVKKFTIKKYIPQFGWSGDNAISERIKAGENLLKWLRNATYTERLNKIPVHLHFIGHSHGGNVINEYTKLAAQDKDHLDGLKVRSIVYLSTPFFTKQAQINTDVLHKKCKIINVYNDYDLTQRFVANFSMHQMPALINAFETDKAFNETLKKLADAPYLKMTAYLSTIPFKEDEFNDILPMSPKDVPGWALGKTRRLSSFYTGPELWAEILAILKNIDVLLDQIQSILEELNINYPKFITTDILKSLSEEVIDNLRDDLTDPINNIENRLRNDESTYTLHQLFEDTSTGLASFVKNTNSFLEFKAKDSKNTSGLQSSLSDIVGKILLNQIETFDDTTHKPDAQFNTPEAKQNAQFIVDHINVTNKDPYHTCMESKNHAAFIKKLEQLEDDYVNSNQQGDDGANIRAEIVFYLLAQENYGIFNLLDILLMWIGAITNEGTKSLIKLTRKNIARYSEKLHERDFKIIHHDFGGRSNISYYLPYGEGLDKTYKKLKHKIGSYFTTPFGTAKGGIPYLAVESHSVSRRTLLNEVSFEWGTVMPRYGITLDYYIKRSCSK